jgi:hypothetical protein
MKSRMNKLKIMYNPGNPSNPSGEGVMVSR